ncbi:MAG: hypothetical protein A2X71_12970 [Thiobacillus sp. GWE1_62_9]|nr:MAG: hypothetical protein A2X71_12970 [Thiobacillus sp. GWE1_62_9]
MLLMLALPVQTFASASMLGCALSHQAAAEQMAMADDMMAGCHESEQPDAPPAQHDCKHCAVCALASSLPVPVSLTGAVMPMTQSYTSYPVALSSSFVPDGPERPPRPTLA